MEVPDLHYTELLLESPLYPLSPIRFRSFSGREVTEHLEPSKSANPDCADKGGGFVFTIENDDEEGTTICPVTADGRRWSRLWMREKRGKRWVEDNYEDARAALRRLR